MHSNWVPEDFGIFLQPLGRRQFIANLVPDFPIPSMLNPNEGTHAVALKVEHLEKKMTPSQIYAFQMQRPRHRCKST